MQPVTDGQLVCMKSMVDTRLLRLNDFLFSANMDNVNLFKVHSRQYTACMHIMWLVVRSVITV